MAWGKEWPSVDNGSKIIWAGVTTPETKFKSLENTDIIWIEPTKKVHNNKMPTHDPYTNPNTEVYYECECGAILDPGTKSFAALNNAASDKGWKIRWNANGQGYKPHCIECGEGVE